MLDEYDQPLERYFDSWRRLVAERSDQAFFEHFRPTSVGWKVQDSAEYQARYAELKKHCDHIVEVWMNGRWIAKMHFKDATLNGDIQIIKLMERRPGSTDAIGLDHVDFYNQSMANAETILTAEKDLRWTHEINDIIQGYDWISLWFDNTEAKLKSDTVIDIVIAELAIVNQKIIQ